MKIEKIIGREILDSRGNPTVEVHLSRQEHPRENTKHWNCVTATKNVTEAKVS